MHITEFILLYNRDSHNIANLTILQFLKNEKKKLERCTLSFWIMGSSWSEIEADQLQLNF